MKKRLLIKIISTLLLGLTTVPFTGCGLESDSTPNIDYNAALVVTTDYYTGAYAAISLEDLTVVPDIEFLHPDLTCAFDPLTKTPFILQRFGSDSIVVLDPEDLSIVNEYSVGPGTNPYDIAVVADDRAYVSRFGSAEMLVIHPMTGEELGTVDLIEFADDDDLPEMSGLYVHGGKVYVLVSRLDTLNYWKPTGNGLLVVLSAETGEIEDSFELAAPNPYEKARYSHALDALVITSPGDFTTLDDGGIELFYPDDNSLSGLIVHEADLGGNVTSSVIVNETKGYALVAVPAGYGSDTHVVIFNPESGEKAGTLLETDGWVYTSIALKPDGTELWVTDTTPENPGVRVYDTETDQEITTAPIATGLPPAMICFTGL